MDKAYTLGQSAHLFDHATGEFVVVVDKNGKETMLVKSEVDPATGMVRFPGGGMQSPIGRIGILGDSRALAEGTPSWHFLTLANALAGHPYDLTFYGGVGGNTTGQVRARVGSAIAANISACVVLCGTNNAWSDRAGVDAALADVYAIYDALRDSGIYVFGLSELPNTTKPTAWAQLAQYFNTQLSRYWETHAGGEYIDAWSAIVDPITGLAKSTYMSDGLHLASAGSWAIAQTLVAPMARRGFAGMRPLVSSAIDFAGVNAQSNQYLANPICTGTGGIVGAGNTGSLPDYYTGSGAATCAYSIVSRADGIGNDIKVVATATAGQTVETRHQNIDGSIFSIGSQWVIDAEVTVESCSNLTGLYIGMNLAGTQHMELGQLNGVSGVTLVSSKTFRISSRPFSVEVVPAWAFLAIGASFKDSASGAITARFGRVSLRKVS